MAELGWEVTAHEDGGGVSYEGTVGQVEAMDAAFAACDEAMEYDTDDYFTEEYLTLSYDDQLQVRQCLQEAGYEISEPPSREVFIEQTMQQRLRVWDPLMDVPDAEFDTAQARCPGTPGWELLNDLDR